MDLSQRNRTLSQTEIIQLGTIILVCNAAFLALDVVSLSGNPLLSSRENARATPFPFHPTSREISRPKDGVVLEGVGEEGEGYPQRCCVIFWKFIYLNKNGRRRERRGETVSVNRIHSHCHGLQCQASRAAMASVLIVAVIFCQAGAG